MKKSLVAILTGMALLAGPVVFAKDSAPRNLDESRMQQDYKKRNEERKAYQEQLKKKQEAITVKHDSEIKRKEASKKKK